MRRSLMVMIVLLLATSVFGQVPATATPAKPIEGKLGMVWHWFEGAKKCNTELDTAIAERQKAFAVLADRVKEGDKNKIRLHMRNVHTAQFAVVLAVACGGDYSRNLEEMAGVALVSMSDFSSVGKMTEKEYDEAVALIKTLREKIKGRFPTENQKKIWDSAIKATGEDPESYSYKID